MTTKETYTLTWQQINITIQYTPSYSKAFKEAYDIPLTHIEVFAKEPLPFTETGYRSLFLKATEVDTLGGAIPLVEAWLKEAAQSKKWKKYTIEKQQLSLF